MGSFNEAEALLAKADDPSTVHLEAWYMDDSHEDQRAEHRRSPNEPVAFQTVADLGVLYWKLDADKYETDPKLAAIRNVHGYGYVEVDVISPEKVPTYDTKIKGLFEEHIHTYEEVRLVLDGSGYFDVRDHEDRWIRIAAHKGDLLIVPVGIYHRFTTDSKNYIKALRIFVDGPLATRLGRPQDDHPSRLLYLESQKLVRSRA